MSGIHFYGYAQRDYRLRALCGHTSEASDVVWVIAARHDTRMCSTCATRAASSLARSGTTRHEARYVSGRRAFLTHSVREAVREDEAPASRL